MPGVGRSRVGIVPDITLEASRKMEVFAHARQKNDKQVAAKMRSRSLCGAHTIRSMITITEEQRELYRTEGYLILPGVIPPDMLNMLREECSYYLGYYDSIMDS